MGLAIDRSLATIAEWQFGAFTRAQAVSCGHTEATIKRRLRVGVWRRVLPAVYALTGSAPSWHQRQMAACLWIPDALAAGRAAGFLYGLPQCDAPPVEIMTSRQRRNPHPTTVVHHTIWLPREQATMLDGIPVTSIERTLMSLSAQLSRRDSAMAIDQALTRGLTTLALLDRHLFFTARQGRDGCRPLREITKDRLVLDQAPNSPLETLIYEMVLEEGLPIPKAQLKIHDGKGAFVARPDFAYPDQRVIVEGHSRLWHDGFEMSINDVKRERRLETLGYRIVYATWVDVTRNRRATADLIRRMLADPSLRASQGSRRSRNRGNFG